jgi:hypothetical protein
MGLVVTGISPTSDIGTLQAALREADLSVDHIELVEPGDDTGPLAHGVVTAPHIGGLETGTGVPGLTSGSMTGTTREYFHDTPLSQRLNDFEIPDDEVDNYLDALAAGRTIVAYFAKDDTIDRVEAAFRAAGIANVKRF